MSPTSPLFLIANMICKVVYILNFEPLVYTLLLFTLTKKIDEKKVFPCGKFLPCKTVPKEILKYKHINIHTYT